MERDYLMFKHIEMVKNTERAKHFFEDYASYTIDPFTLNENLKTQLNDFNLIDVRDYDSYLEGHIPFAEHFPIEDFDASLEIISKSKPTVVYCYNISCNLAKKICLKLVKRGYPAVELVGGFNDWKKRDYEVVKTSASDY